MSAYQRWIEKKEIEGAGIHAPFKKLHAFEWGLDHLRLGTASRNPSDQLAEYTRHHLAHSAAYFTPPDIAPEAYRLIGKELSFPSTITSFDVANNTAYFNYFPVAEIGTIVLVVPHWNSDGKSYDSLCRWINGARVAALRLSLPFHGRRDAARRLGRTNESNSTLMVSANIGLTIQAMRQCVHDILSAVTWCQRQGYKKIGIIGASIGSCAAFLAAAHDSRIRGFFANLMSSYFGEVVWTGLSTAHIRQSLETHVSLDELRSFWLLNSPIAFVAQLAQRRPQLRQRIVSARFDLTFPYYLTVKQFQAYDRHNIEYDHITLPCGHYTLGKYWFRFLDAYFILGFLRGLSSTGP